MKEFYSGAEERRMEEERQWRERMAEETARVAAVASGAGVPADVAAENIRKNMEALGGPTPAELAKAQFLVAFGQIHRPGAENLLAWLKSTDFFTAPASTKHHGAVRGGLVIHSVNVWTRLWGITMRDMNDNPAPGLWHMTEEQEETVAILGLLHDLCKVGVYHTETKRRKNPDTGVWEDYTGYTFRDTLPLGHGEKSLFLITRHMELTEEEALAIRWHMGAYDAAVKGGDRAMNEAMRLSPWVWRLQEADMCASYIDEQEAAEK